MRTDKQRQVFLSAIVIISERCPVEEFQRSISPSPSPQLSRVLTPPFHMLPRRCRTGSCTVDRPQRAVRESYLLLHCSPQPLLQPFSCSVCSVFALGFTLNFSLTTHCLSSLCHKQYNIHYPATRTPRFYVWMGVSMCVCEYIGM